MTRIICYSLIFISAYRRLPEFRGYRSASYPGTTGPRAQTITPRRMNLPPNFESDWKKIGSKRTEMLVLNMPLWQKQVRKKKSTTISKSFVPVVEIN